MNCSQGVEREVTVVDDHGIARQAVIPDLYAVTFVSDESRSRHVRLLDARVSSEVVDARLVEGDIYSWPEVVTERGEVENPPSAVVGDVDTAVLVILDDA